MRQDELDRLLSSEDEIVPSTGFARSVMDAVRREAATPPPIPFPWKRAMPGLLSCAVAIVWAIWVGVRTPAQASTPAINSILANWMDQVAPLLNSAQMFGAGWVLLGLLLTAACLKFTWHLAGGRV